MKYAVKKNQKINNLLNEGKSYIQKIEEKIKDQLNNYCVECGEENPEFISINNGIFLCRDCVQNHLKFPKNISKIKKNNIKSLTLNEIQYLLCGGNRSLLNFICNEYPKLAELPSNILYRTQAMIYYRQNLLYLISGCIPPIKPSIESAYKIPDLFDNINNNNDYENINEIINKNGIYNNTENTNFYVNNNLEYNFRYGEKINNNNQNIYNNIDNRLTLNTIGNKSINYDNYFINKPKQINFQNNHNIIIGNKMEFINNINNNKKHILHSTGKINSQNSNFNRYYNNISNANNDIYVRPKLILSHNVSRTCLLNKNKLNQRTNSYDKLNNKYFYSQVNNIEKESKIDFIQLNFKDNNYNYKKRKLNKNLSHEIYKKTKNYIKSNKLIHKSFSQKIFDNINYKNNNSNKYTPVNQTENNNFVPKKVSKIIYSKNANDTICITNNEKFEIIPEKKTIKIINNINANKIIDNISITNTINNNRINYKNIKENENFNTLPIQMNIKVNKKEIKEKNIPKKENIESLNKSKNEIKKNDNIKKFISKCNKNRILIRQKERKQTLTNKYNNNKEKDKELNNDKINVIKKRRLFKNSSQEDILKLTNNNNQTKISDNKNEKIGKKNVSIRNRYKVKTRHNNILNK